jgi:AcrR family transcriptional regulator
VTEVRPGTRDRTRSRAHVKRRRGVTRERILEAAERLFLERGFSATSVHEIAADAGYTTGAVYSSFSGKADLFLAVADRLSTRQREIWRQAIQSVPDSKDAAAAMGAALALAMPKPAWSAVHYEFLSYAYRDERLRDEMARRYRDSNAYFSSLLEEVSSSSALPVDRLAQTVLALMRGHAVTWFADPDLEDTTLFSDAVAVLFGAVTPDLESSGRGMSGQAARVPESPVESRHPRQDPAHAEVDPR